MKTYWHPERISYDGCQLRSLWAFRAFGLQGDSLVSFAGPCQVGVEALVDVADALARAPIYSQDMLHFIAEHFSLDLEKTVLRQRLLMVIIKELLEQTVGVRLVRSGDDLYYQGRKLSVSIATLSPVSTLIHAGLNIVPEGTPVPAAGLVEMGLKNIPGFAQAVLAAYAAETEGIYLARCKVRGVE
ncbi:MAG: DUF366 family protein [Clostridia bacterium]|nr:MAG: DUF366 family protein [Clostridia bacterium]